MLFTITFQKNSLLSNNDPRASPDSLPSVAIIVFFLSQIMELTTWCHYINFNLCSFVVHPIILLA